MVVVRYVILALEAVNILAEKCHQHISLMSTAVLSFVEVLLEEEAHPSIRIAATRTVRFSLPVLGVGSMVVYWTGDIASLWVVVGDDLARHMPVGLPLALVLHRCATTHPHPRTSPPPTFSLESDACAMQYVKFSQLVPPAEQHHFRWETFVDFFAMMCWDKSRDAKRINTAGLLGLSSIIW